MTWQRRIIVLKRRLRRTRKFKSAIQSAKKVAQSFKKTQESIKDTKLDGDSSGVMKAVKAAKDAVKGFENTHADAELDADISDVREKSHKLSRWLKSSILIVAMQN